MPNANPCNEHLKEAMLNVCSAFDKLSARRKGEAATVGVACLRRGSCKTESVQLAAIEEAYNGIGAPGDWGYGTKEGDGWYKLLLLTADVEKANSGKEVAHA